MEEIPHTVRMNESRLVKVVSEAGKDRKRKKGRPRETWIGRIQEIEEKRGKAI